MQNGGKRKRVVAATSGDDEGPLNPAVVARLRAHAPTFLCMGARVRQHPAALELVSSPEAQEDWAVLLHHAPVVFLSLPPSLRRAQWAQAAGYDGTHEHLHEWERAAATCAPAFIHAPKAARCEDSVISEAMGTVSSWVDAIRNSKAVSTDFRRIPYNVRNDHSLCATALERDPSLVAHLTFKGQRTPSLYEPCLARDARLLRHVHDRSYPARRMCDELLLSAVRVNSAVYFQLDEDEREGLAPAATAGVPGLLSSTLLSQTPNAVGPHCLRLLYDVAARPGHDLVAWEEGWLRGTVNNAKGWGAFAAMSCGTMHILHKALRVFTHPEESRRQPAGVAYLPRGSHETRDAHIRRIALHSKAAREPDALVVAVLRESAADLKAATDAFNALVTRRREAGALLFQGDLPWLSPGSLAFGVQRLRVCASEQVGEDGQTPALLETLDVITLKDAADLAIRDLPDGKQAPAFDGDFEAHFLMQLSHSSAGGAGKACTVLSEEWRQGGRGAAVPLPASQRLRYLPFTYLEGHADRRDIAGALQGVSPGRSGRGSALLAAAEAVVASQARAQQALWVLGLCMPIIADFSHAIKRFVGNLKGDPHVRDSAMLHFANVLDIVELAHGRQRAVCETTVAADGSVEDNVEVTLWPRCFRGVMRIPAATIFEPRPTLHPSTRSILSEFSLSMNGLSARAGKIIAVVRALKTAERTLALAMCTHPRLGARSILNELPEHLVAMIGDMLWDRRTRQSLLFDSEELHVFPQKNDFENVGPLLKTLTLHD